ncbi:MAG: divergent polysaccharide deacetylase family protein [Candidatus Omnitrophica bacterium]|nr:divergent polysaccharide deacetylase family protein [Candidatus Omnitrophota bacterium]
MKKYILLAVVAILVISTVIIILNREKAPKGRIVFIIDDWGYNNKNIDLLFAIDRPVTAAILPGLRYTREIVDKIKEKNSLYDIILHLPLESKSNRAAERDTIKANMSDDEVIALLEKDLESVPGAIGVSSHQGSKVTQDNRVMGLILKELKKRKLFFVDSLTTPDSVCSGIAKGLGVRYAERDVFLDITDQTDTEHFEAYIRKQIRELAEIALVNKIAIGIGHTRSATLKVIKELIPELERQGIEIVPLKEMVK